VILEVDDPGLVTQGAGLGDHVQVLVVEPDVAHRHDVHVDLEQRIPHPANARAQDLLELTIAEDETALVLTNLETTQHHQCAPPFDKSLRDGAPAATSRAWSAT
jgi:hypothetical protein